LDTRKSVSGIVTRRHSLEEAHVFVALLTKTHKVRSSSTLMEFLKTFQKKATALSFPELLAAAK
jgi:hypothetical protein